MEREKEPISFRVYLTVTMFGISGGYPIRALWLELPILEKYLPERDKLGLLLLVLLQCCSIIAVIYIVVRYCMARRLSEIPVIYSSLCVGVTSLVVLGCFWSDTAQIEGEHHSFAVLVGTLLAGLVANMAAVTYIPFTARLKPSYMTALLLGNVLSFILPHVLVTAQGAGDAPQCDTSILDDAMSNATLVDLDPQETAEHLRSSPAPRYLPFHPRYSVSLYFLVGTIVAVVSGLSFVILRWTKKCQSEYRENWSMPGEGEATSSLSGIHRRPDDLGDDDVWRAQADGPTTFMLDDGSVRQSQLYNERETPSPAINSSKKAKLNLAHNNHSPVRLGSSNIESAATTSDFQNVTRTRFEYVSDHQNPVSISSLSPSTFAKPNSFKLLLAISFWTSLIINGPLSSVSSYNCYPEGNIAFKVGALLTDAAMVIACLVAARTRNYKSPVAIVIALTSLATILLTYFVALITFSKLTETQNSPLFGNAGELLAMVAWVAVVGLFTYIEVTIGVQCGAAGTEAAMRYSCCICAAAVIGRLFTVDNIMICRIFRNIDPCVVDAS